MGKITNSWFYFLTCDANQWKQICGFQFSCYSAWNCMAIQSTYMRLPVILVFASRYFLKPEQLFLWMDGYFYILFFLVL